MIAPLARNRVERALLLAWIVLVLVGSLATSRLPGPPLAQTLERILGHAGR